MLFDPRDEALASPPAAPPAAPPPPPPLWRRWLRPRRVVALAGALLVLLVGWLAITAPLSRSLRPIAPPAVTLLAADGRMIARRGAITDQPVNVRRLPPYVGQAFVAIEDRRFYRHWGVDPQGIARAAWHNLRAGGVREGGSTITQQLAKLVFLKADRTMGRKARESLIAFWLEAWLSKDEILSRYLSDAYFGDNVYGLRAAARHYFDVPPERLSLGQAALLAGLMKAPSRLAPSGNLAGARARARLVLGAMVEAGFLSAARAAAVPPVRLRLRGGGPAPDGGWFADWVLPAARAEDEDPYAPRTIATTLDRRLQRAAERAARQAPAGLQVAMVAMRPDGRVVAMVGGRRYADSPFNRAVQARRQPGSTFKLFVYLAALRAGMTPDDHVEDTRLTLNGWSPVNADGRYRGSITLREAFARSSNVAAVRLTQQVGPQAVAQAARDLGVASPLAADASLALGTSGVTLLELTAAYASVAAKAYPVRPYGVPPPPQSWLERLRTRQHGFSGRETAMLRDLLSATVNRGTARGAALDRPVFGKTGTTQDNRDALFVGFADGLVLGVWVGRDDNQPMRGIAGGGLPARIWRDFMIDALGARPAGAPVPRDVDPDSGLDHILEQAGLSDLRIGDVGLHIGGDGIEIRPVRPDPPPPPEPRD
ncbi:transglycosylase domain-containing protein [Sphingomonas morindae]|uniref:peptidoglycan glycosyltransferase n=1 Tax=Sphingomonas morindae TaxID=1541170 RepID=A0ABY4X591_9SPHN|nr:transglycosylase domain-containing protein [Sphingomonas morindae]USI72055.1 transglycosylase domain-containing protein [Sphingomonas morindae]